MDDYKEATTDGIIVPVPVVLMEVAINSEVYTSSLPRIPTTRTALDTTLKDSTLSDPQKFDGPYDKRLYYSWGRVKIDEERNWLELCKSVTPRNITFGDDWSVGDEAKLWETSWDSSAEAELQKTSVEEIELYRRAALFFNSEPSILFSADIKSGKYPPRFPAERRRSQPINLQQVARDFILSPGIAQKLAKLLCNPVFRERLDFFHFVLRCAIKARSESSTQVSQPRIRQLSLDRAETMYHAYMKTARVDLDFDAFHMAIDSTLGVEPILPRHFKIVKLLPRYVLNKNINPDLLESDLDIIISAWDAYASALGLKISDQYEQDFLGMSQNVVDYRTAAQTVLNMKRAYLMDEKRAEAMWYWKGFEKWRDHKLSKPTDMQKGMAKEFRAKAKEQAIEKLASKQSPPISPPPKIQTASKIKSRDLHPKLQITNRKPQLMGNSDDAFWMGVVPASRSDTWRPRNRNRPAEFEIERKGKAEEDSPCVRSNKKRRL